jgi:hypothetical protein
VVAVCRVVVGCVPIALSPECVAAIVKAYASRPFFFSATACGASLFEMMDVSRHKSIDTLRTCVRVASTREGPPPLADGRSRWRFQHPGDVRSVEVDARDAGRGRRGPSSDM